MCVNYLKVWICIVGIDMRMLAVRQGYAVYAVRKQGVSDDGSFCISRLGRVRVALRSRSTTQPPRCDPQGCHEPKNDPIGTPHALGKSPFMRWAPWGLEHHCHHQAAC